MNTVLNHRACGRGGWGIFLPGIFEILKPEMLNYFLEIYNLNYPHRNEIPDSIWFWNFYPQLQVQDHSFMVLRAFFSEF